MIVVDFETQEKAFIFMKAILQDGIYLAVSLGATDTYICHPASTTHSEMSDEEFTEKQY